MRHVAIGALVLVAAAAAMPRALGTPLPNFVFILADDWGYGDTGAYKTLLNHGPDVPATPRLDAFAAQGAVFTQFDTLGAECSPSRASWITGRSPSDPDVRIHLVIGTRADNHVKGNANWLNTSVPTVTRIMNGAGYQVGHFGKWHLGMVAPNGTGPADAGAPPLAAYGINASRCYVCRQADMYDTSDLWWPANSSRLIVDDALAFVNASVAAGRPFYLNLHLHISHAPMRPTPTQRAAYAAWALNKTGADPVAMCPGPNPQPHKGGYTECPPLDYRASQFEADAQIGRFLDALDAMRLPPSWPRQRRAGAGTGEGTAAAAAGAAVSAGTAAAAGGATATEAPVPATTTVGQHTLIVMSGDNGPEDPHIYFNSVGDPGPFRGRKRSLYSGGVRMPLLARYPAALPAGTVSDADLMSADWLPTVASLAGLQLPPATASALFGRDASGAFAPTRRQPPAARTAANPKMWDYRADGYGYCWNQAPRLAIADWQVPGLKLFLNPDGSRVELFNLSAATFEANNLAGDPAMAPVVARLRARLEAWQATVPQSPLMKATHMGCLAYEYPAAGPGAGSASHSGGGGAGRAPMGEDFGATGWQGVHR